MKFWKATCETRNFTFEAYGLREAEASLLMQETLRCHAEKLALGKTWPCDLDVNIEELEIGAGYRDHTKIASMEGLYGLLKI